MFVVAESRESLAIRCGCGALTLARRGAQPQPQQLLLRAAHPGHHLAGAPAPMAVHAALLQVPPATLAPSRLAVAPSRLFSRSESPFSR